MLKTNSNLTDQNLFLKLVLMLLMLSIPIKNQRLEKFCGIGCLRCDFESLNCLLCDSKNFFFFDDPTQLCIQKIPSNCQMALNSEFCHVCKSGYFPDRNGQCRNLSDSSYNSDLQTVEGCLLYAGGLKCGICGDGLYLTEDGNCESSLVTEKTNCEVLGKDRCLVCSVGTVWDDGFSSCVAESKLSNCSSRNMKWMCKNSTCNSGQYPNININTLLTESITNNEDTLLRITLRLSHLHSLNLLFDGPFLNNLLNLEIASLTILERNRNKKYLKNNMLEIKNLTTLKGQANYNKVLPNYKQTFSVVQLLFPYCQKIDSQSTLCVECFDGYSLEESSGICTPVARKASDLIPNCLSLEFEDSCFECADGFSLGENGTCLPERSRSKTNSTPESVIQTKKINLRPMPFDENDQGSGNLENIDNTNENSEKKSSKPVEKKENEENQNLPTKNDSKEPSGSKLESQNKPNNNQNESSETQENKNTEPNQESQKIDEQKLNDPSSEIETIPSNPEQSSTIFRMTPSQSALMNWKDLGPEQIIQVAGLEIISSEGQAVPFTDNKSYLLTRQYDSTPIQEGVAGLASETTQKDYLVVFEEGQVLMASAENFNQDNSSDSPVISQTNIAENCRTMLMKENIPSCSACTDSNLFILVPLNLQERNILRCQVRSQPVKNCKQHELDSPKCQECETNFVLYHDNQREKSVCLSTIENCESHSFVDGKVNCEKCLDGFVWAFEECQAKIEEIENCSSVEANKCIACEEGYFLFNGICIVEIKSLFYSCLNDLLGEDSCQCGTNGIVVGQENSCVAIDEDNCLKAANSLCTECRNGYSLNSNNQCVKGQIPNCLTYNTPQSNSQICKECESGYVLDNLACRRTLKIFTQNCQETKAENCLTCKPGFYLNQLNKGTSWEFLSSPNLIQPEGNLIQVCAENVFYNIYSNMQDCLKFNTITKKCELCKEGKYLNSDGKCGSCDLAVNALDNLSISCVSPNLPLDDCLMYDGEQCIKCKSDNPVRYEGELYSTRVRTYSDRSQNLYNETPGFVITDCNSPISETCATTHCEETVQINAETSCCRKCKWSRTGIWSKQNETHYTLGCDSLVDFCNAQIRYKEIPIEYFRELTCNFCEDNRVLKLSPQENFRQLECVEIESGITDVDGCYLYVHEYCRLCKPGFRILQEGTQESNTTCEEISNCELSETIGKCEKCSDGFVLSHDSLNCVRSSIQSCEQIDKDGTCIKCSSGMTLQDITSAGDTIANRVCVSVNRPDCAKFNGDDCVSCKQTTSENQNERILVTLSRTKFTSNQTSKFGFCVNASLSTLNPSISNCLVYTSPNDCEKCASGFILKMRPQSGFECSLPNPDMNHCHKLNESGDLCIQCKPKYYLEGGRCFSGEIFGCHTYQSALFCETCNDGYSLLNTSNKSKCYISHKIDGCAENNINFSLNPENSFLNRVNLMCSKCDSNLKLAFDQPSDTRCMKLNSIKNCKKVNSFNSRCDECESLYYWKPEKDLQGGSECVRRKNVNIAHCSKLKLNSEGCEECETGYQPADDNLTCLKIVKPPLNGCLLHSLNRSECLICDISHYKNQDQESPKCISPKKVIENCSEYDESGDKCTLCKTGYALAQDSESKNQVCVATDSLNSQDFEIKATTIQMIESNSLSNDNLNQQNKDGENVQNQNDDSIVQEFEALSDSNQTSNQENNSQNADIANLSSNNQNIEIEATVESNPETEVVIQRDDPSIFERILQDSNVELVTNIINEETSKAQNQIANNVADTATDTILGPDANPIVKNLVNSQIKNQINSQTQQSTENINEKIKNHVNSINKKFEEKTPEEIEDLKNFFKDKDPSDLQNLIDNVDTTDGNDQNSKISQGENGQNGESITVNSKSENTLSVENKNNENNNNSNQNTIENSVVNMTTQKGSNNESKEDVKGIFCGLCENGYNFSTVSNRCTKNPEKGCLLVNKAQNSSEIPCIVCVPGYFQNQNGICVQNLNIENHESILRKLSILVLSALLIFV